MMPNYLSDWDQGEGHYGEPAPGIPSITSEQHTDLAVSNVKFIAALLLCHARTNLLTLALPLPHNDNCNLTQINSTDSIGNEAGNTIENTMDTQDGVSHFSGAQSYSDDGDASSTPGTLSASSPAMTDQWIVNISLEDPRTRAFFAPEKVIAAYMLLNLRDRNT
jgi:hypothetical protein